MHVAVQTSYVVTVFSILLSTRQVMIHLQESNGLFMALKVTDFLGSGICIGITFNHAIADGNSFWYFMKYWSDHCRGFPVSNKPEHMRTIFKRHKTNNCAIPNISFKAEELVYNQVKEAQIMKFLRDDLSPMNSSAHQHWRWKKSGNLKISFQRRDY